MAVPFVAPQGCAHQEASVPRYDYKCTACERVFEVERRIADVGEETCPECGAPAKRVFTPVGVHFKGSGFHNTDYKPSAPAEKEPSACPAKDTGSSSACESCPAAN